MYIVYIGEQQTNIMNSRNQQTPMMIDNSDTDLTDAELLLHSVEVGRLDHVTGLLDLGIDVNISINGITPLFIAAQNGHFNICEELLKRGAFVDGIDEQSPIWAAAYNGHGYIVLLLIEHGANVNKIANNATPLWVAIQENLDQSIIEALIFAGADINFRFAGTEMSCLCKAAFDGHINLVKLLIDKGAKLELSTSKGETALHGACYRGNFEVVKLLLEANVNVNSKTNAGQTPLFFADVSKDNRIRNLLAENGALPIAGDPVLKKFLRLLDVYPDPLRINPKHIEEYKKILESGCCVGYAYNCLYLHDKGLVNSFHKELQQIYEWDERLDSLLQSSDLSKIIFEHMHMLVNLSKKFRFYTPNNSIGFIFQDRELNICLSLILNHLSKIVICNIGHSISVAKEKVYTGDIYTIYDFRSSSGPIIIHDFNELCQRIKFLLGNNTNTIGLIINGINSENHPEPAFSYLQSFLIDIIKKRAAENAINYVDDKGFTMLHYSAQAGNIELVRSLISSGAIFKDSITNVVPPIYLAVQTGSIELVKTFIHAGLDDLDIYFMGTSLLSLAVSLDYINMTRFLIKNGANPNGVTGENWAPILHALKNENYEIRHLLLEHGCKPPLRIIMDNLGDIKESSDRYVSSSFGKTYC